MPDIVEFARAKVNLTLRVRGRRADGYHDLESLIVFAADAADHVRLETGAPVGVLVTGPYAAAIGGTNLVATALDRLAAAEPRLALGAVHLEKRLPVAAGIGGGSADAAALLRAVRHANPELAEHVDWYGIAGSLGADVPVCFNNEAAFVWGVGEHMQPLACLPRLEGVLVNPRSPVPADKTAQVFARLGAPAAGAQAAPPPTPGPFADAGALVAYVRAQGNDLAAAAAQVVPEINAVHAALGAARDCLTVGLSGAGPTCVGIFATRDQAAEAAATLQRSEPKWWVAQSSFGR